MDVPPIEKAYVPRLAAGAAIVVGILFVFVPWIGYTGEPWPRSGALTSYAAESMCLALIGIWAGLSRMPLWLRAIVWLGCLLAVLYPELEQPIPAMILVISGVLVVVMRQFGLHVIRLRSSVATAAPPVPMRFSIVHIFFATIIVAILLWGLREIPRWAEYMIGWDTVLIQICMATWAVALAGLGLWAALAPQRLVVRTACFVVAAVVISFVLGQSISGPSRYAVRMHSIYFSNLAIGVFGAGVIARVMGYRLILGRPGEERRRQVVEQAAALDANADAGAPAEGARIQAALPVEIVTSVEAGPASSCGSLG